MRIYRIHSPFLLSQTEIILNKESSHHLANVLRCREGDICHVFDGVGNEVKTKILQVNKSNMPLQVLEFIENKVESPLKIHLFQGLCKGDKMDVIIQKSIELGVAEITPLITERCDVKLSNERLEKRMRHWQNIIINATEQSGRAVLAKLNEPVSLHAALQQPTSYLRLLFTPHAAKNLADIHAPAHNNVAIFIGPEGGFSDSETMQAIDQGVEAIVLGKRILRTETAPIGIIASLQTLWGDFK
ncbi:MAG: 16S rRNA (uracil(1498)-N(3))-methyltransferase [Pseudomonadota bacterium]